MVFGVTFRLALAVRRREIISAARPIRHAVPTVIATYSTRVVASDTAVLRLAITNTTTIRPIIEPRLIRTRVRVKVVFSYSNSGMFVVLTSDCRGAVGFD